MARDSYDQYEYRHHAFGQRGYMMEPGWGWNGESADPNYRGGGYQGMRMGQGQGEGHGQAPYGRYRAYHQADLAGYGGFQGRNELPNGWYDDAGYYHEARDPRAGRGQMSGGMRGYDRGFGGPRHPEGGGVRYDGEYLGEYNANSPAMRGGGPRRSWGFAPGPDAPPMRGRGDPRGRPSDEHRYNGYNQGGFADNGYRGPGTRGANPNR